MELVYMSGEMGSIFDRKIRKLSQVIINQISAGEVVERPASVIKELVENSIDAGAKKVEVSIIDGGKNFISVRDDGCGMSREDLPLAFERHATSKLAGENLFDINTFGFRGEALASISSIARVFIRSRFRNDTESYCIRCDERGVSEVSPAEIVIGTVIEVCDLFYATPARLKFLKSTNVEADACASVMQNMAIDRYDIGFKYIEDGKVKFDYGVAGDRLERVLSIFGKDFIDNTRYIKNATDGLSMEAFLGLPNYNKATSSSIRIFVNSRYVKDKQLVGIIKSAYKEVIPSGRFPVCILFLELRNDLVDINVHPAKTEVRFRDFDLVKGFLYSTIKKSILNEMGQYSSSALTRMGLAPLRRDISDFIGNARDSYYSLKKLRDSSVKNGVYDLAKVSSGEGGKLSVNGDKKTIFRNSDKYLKDGLLDNFSDRYNNALFYNSSGGDGSADVASDDVIKGDSEADVSSSGSLALDLGRSIAQIDLKYIVAKNDNNELIIVDQHAVCERINLEKLLNRESLESQQLLVPEVIVTSRSRVEIAMKYDDILKLFGIFIEKMSFDTIFLRGVPSLFCIENPAKFMSDILDELEENGTIDSFEEKIRLTFATISCHNSIRAGKVLTQIEMDSILRQAERTVNIAQCCHGRPSYIVLKTETLDSLFER